MAMKKICNIAAILIAFLQFQSFSQIEYAPIIGIGTGTLNTYDAGISANAGLLIRADIFDRTGIQAEVMYSFITGKSTDESVNPKSEYSMNATYLNVPVFIYFGISPNIKLLVGYNIAPSFLSGKQKIKAGSTTTETTLSGISSKGSFAAGLEFDIDSPLKFGLRYVAASAGEGGNPSGEKAAPVFDGKTSMVYVTCSYILNW
jgi:hypothetical protein